MVCDLCGRRYFGEEHKGLTYYRCSPNPKHHGHLAWFTEHPRAAYVREDLLLEPLQAFFRDRIFGAGRQSMLAAAAETGDRAAREAAAARQASLTSQLGELQRRQSNLISELEKFEPSGDDEVDAALRARIKGRFAAIVTEQRSIKENLASVKDQARAAASVDISMIDQLPQTAIDLDRLPEDEVRALFDVFQLELRVHPNRQDLVVRVTVTSDTAPVLTSAVTKIVGDYRRLEMPGGRSADLPPGAGPDLGRFGNLSVPLAAHHRFHCANLP